MRKVFTEVLRALVPNLRFGPSDQTKSENFRCYYVESTTPAASTTEFSIEHGMGVTPYLAVPVLPLDSSGVWLAELRVSRPADSQRVYFTSPTTNAVIRLLLE